MNMPRNVLQLFTASVTPASTVRIYEATVEHAWWSVAELASGSMLVVAALVYGLLGPTWKHSIGNAAMFAISMLSVFFPAFVVSHVSELYAYSALPLVTGVIAVAIWKMRGKRLAGPAALLMVIIVAMIQVQAVWSKAALLKANGEAAERLVNQLVGIVRKLPPNSTLYLRDARGDQPAYSVYLERGLSPITDASWYIKYLAKRQDVAVQFIPDKMSIPVSERGVIVVPAVPDNPREGVRILNCQNRQ
jgi:hypothetical protein